MAQLSSQMLWRKPYKSSFLKARHWYFIGGQLMLLIWMQMGMWSFVRAYSSTMPQKLTFLYRFGDINVKSITLSCSPLFYIGSPFSIANTKPLILVLARKHSVYFLLAIYFLFYIKWQALKSPKSIISPLASLIVILTLGYVLI